MVLTEKVNQISTEEFTGKLEHLACEIYAELLDAKKQLKNNPMNYSHNLVST